jgi:16S rRNA (adenine1518-N6/adenine1519-N6)-dimethyltransferase
VARAERLFTIPAGAFFPAPKVDSALLRLDRLPQPLVQPGDTTSFRRLVTGLFSYRRKQLGRGLREFTGWPLPPIAAVLSQVSFPPTTRPESLAPGDFVRLHTALVDAGWAPSADL